MRVLDVLVDIPVDAASATDAIGSRISRYANSQNC